MLRGESLRLILRTSVKFLFLTDCFDHGGQSFLKAVYVIFKWNSFLKWNLTGNHFVEQVRVGNRVPRGAQWLNVGGRETEELRVMSTRRRRQSA